MDTPKRGSLNRGKASAKEVLGLFLLSAVITSLSALGAANFSAEEAESHLNPGGDTSPYSYGASDCTNPKEPISVVFYWNATTANVHTHAGHHGGWSWHGASTQYFYDHYCGPMDGDDASNNGSPPNFARYHMRHWYLFDSYWGTYSLATPHHERSIYCGHAVDDNSLSPPGGFVKGKWDIGYNWHNWNNGGGAHYFAGSDWWGNTDRMRQCNGWTAWNDGWVDFVRID